MANWFDENAQGGNTGVNGGANMAGGQAQPDFAAFQRDYWAPDREQVLASMQQPQAQAGQPQGGGAQQNFGNLSDPRQWDALVASPENLKSWIKSQNPGWNDQLVNYYAGVIKGQPGANDTEKAGSANYYINQKFKQDPFYGGQGGSSGGVGMGYGGLIAPYGAYKTPDQFQAPTVTDQNAPGYQFAKQQGMQGIERSAAARGGLLTGGTLKALDAYNTGLANQTYGDVFNRALSQYQTNANTGIAGYQANQGTFYGNQDHAWQKLYQSMGLGQNSSTAGATGA